MWLKRLSSPPNCLQVFFLREHAYSGLRLKIKPNEIIEKIVVSPEAGEWFYNLVKSVSKKYRIAAPVEYSKLTELINKSKMKN